jgi:hypothetical protein
MMPTSNAGSPSSGKPAMLGSTSTHYNGGPLPPNIMES